MKSVRIVFLIAIICTIAAGTTIAQQRGQYLPGFRGLNVAEQPHPGFSYFNFFHWYPTNSFKDRNGNSVDFDLDLLVDMNVFAYTPKKKVLGATFTALTAVPVMNAALTLPQIGADLSTGIAFGDIYVEPVSLGWNLKKGKGKIRAAYGFMMPSGAKRVTSDFWGHQFTVGGTYHPDEHGMWQIGASSVWEAHHKKRNSDIKVGNNVTFEYGVGKTFIKNQGKQAIQVGVVGYSQFQLTNDSGSDVIAPNLGAKDRVHAIGGEFGLILPPQKMNFMVRVLPEYGARSRTQGVTVFVSVGKTF